MEGLGLPSMGAAPDCTVAVAVSCVLSRGKVLRSFGAEPRCSLVSVFEWADSGGWGYRRQPV